MKYTKLNYEGFENYLVFFGNDLFGGIRYEFKFENRYGASVIKRIGSYGSQYDLFEVAVLKDGHLCYDTEITDDVIGYLSNERVLELLQRIKTL